MPMESQVKFHSPQNTFSGAFQQNNAASTSWKTEVAEDLF